MICVVERKSFVSNPELPEDLQGFAFTHAGGMNWEEEPLLRVNERGAPISKINVEAYASDYASMWRMHERKLWIITGFCFLYLSLKLFGV